MKRKGSPIPPCPHCDDNTGECNHVLVNYDRTFGEYLSGYLAKSNPETETFEAEMIDLIAQGINPTLDDNDFELGLIWESAVDSYDPKDGYIGIDQTPYFNLLEDTEYEYNTISFRYPDDNYTEEEDDSDIPGYSSSGIIFYSEDPPSSVKAFNNNIIETLRSTGK